MWPHRRIKRTFGRMFCVTPISVGSPLFRLIESIGRSRERDVARIVALGSQIFLKIVWCRLVVCGRILVGPVAPGAGLLPFLALDDRWRGDLVDHHIFLHPAVVRFFEKVAGRAVTAFRQHRRVLGIVDAVELRLVRRRDVHLHDIDIRRAGVAALAGAQYLAEIAVMPAGRVRPDLRRPSRPRRSPPPTPCFRRYRAN